MAHRAITVCRRPATQIMVAAQFRWLALLVEREGLGPIHVEAHQQFKALHGPGRAPFPAASFKRSFSLRIMASRWLSVSFDSKRTIVPTVASSSAETLRR